MSVREGSPTFRSLFRSVSLVAGLWQRGCTVSFFLDVAYTSFPVVTVEDRP